MPIYKSQSDLDLTTIPVIILSGFIAVNVSDLPNSENTNPHIKPIEYESHSLSAELNNTYTLQNNISNNSSVIVDFMSKIKDTPQEMLQEFNDIFWDIMA